MRSNLRKPGLVAVAASALIAIGVPLAMAAPTASPPSDAGGYVDSTARCTKPDTAVLFGTTQTSRVAICKMATGEYEYRGVRVSDGAKLIASANRTSDTTFVVNADGVKYTVTPTALSVTANGNTFRTETWTDFHGSSATAGTAKPGTATAPATGATQSKAAIAPGLATPAAPAAPAPTAAVAPTTAAPLPPPLAAEVGGSSSEG